MDQLTELACRLPTSWLLPAMAFALWASLATCTLVVMRLRRGLPVVRYQPRRPVPWRGIDLLLVLVFYLSAIMLLAGLAKPILGPEIVREPASYDVEKSSASHTIAMLFAEGDAWVLLLCGLSAVVLAPVVEEFLFRLLLQGCLETAGRRLRPKMPTLRRWVPGAIGPIAITSYLFALMHFRVQRPIRHLSYHVYVVAGSLVVGVLVMAFAICLLRFRAGATAEDFGFVPDKLLADVGLGMLAFAGLAAPTYAAMLLLGSLLPKYLAPDPFVLYFFSLALGILYYRTHRIVPAIVLHMSLNATSLAMALTITQK